MMIKITVLLPTCYNDLTQIPQSVLSNLILDLDDITDGHTFGGHVSGTYRMDNEDMVTDRCGVFWVVCDMKLLPQLRDWAANCAKVLRQESIYFEVQQVQVEFIRA